ncbi:hypothetical protein [Actinophytocola glycyrrhizae]|uniref:Uncharacterized protein n=1 Tax=Actinophytocola glycyrrhizae TaxID=2044873 RepID=A0ABV9S0K4_9PSEU
MVAVVAAIGVTAVLLRPAGQGGGGVRVAGSTTPTTRPAPAGPLPGWETIPIDEAVCDRNPSSHVPGTPPDSLLPRAVVEPAFTGAVQAVTGPVASATRATWESYSAKLDGPSGYLEVEVPMDNGNGQLQLEVRVYGGTPVAMAGASLYFYGECLPPARHVLADGTVLQLHQVHPGNPQQPVQHLRIYRPDGREYILTAAGWSEADLVPTGGGAFTIAGGRGKLPTTGAQLAEIATRLVTNLG